MNIFKYFENKRVKQYKNIYDVLNTRTLEKVYNHYIEQHCLSASFYRDKDAIENLTAIRELISEKNLHLFQKRR